MSIRWGGNIDDPNTLTSPLVPRDDSALPLFTDISVEELKRQMAVNADRELKFFDRYVGHKRWWRRR